MNIFGSVHLGYVVIDTEKFAEWRRFGRDAIGMHLDEPLPDVMRFRLDSHECRFLVRRGSAEDVSALGWQVDDIHQTVAELTGKGLQFTRYPYFEQSADGVWTAPGGVKVAWFKDPDGNTLSLSQH